MSEERNELKAALQALAEKKQPQLGDHATPEESLAYHSGGLSAAEKERLREHVVWCRECLELLLDAAAWVESGQEEGRRSEAEVAVAWQAMQRRLRGRDQGSGIRDQGPQTRDTDQRTTDHGLRTTWLSRWLSPVGLPYALAASLLIVSLALGAWIVSLRQETRRLAEREQALAAAMEQIKAARQQLEESARRSQQYKTEVANLRQTVDELSQPQLNVPIADLYPRELIREQGRPSTIQTIAVPSSANLFTLILNVGERPSYPAYALEIVDQQGQPIWSGDGLQKSPEENFTVTLSRRLFPAGQYRLRLYGLRGDRRQMVEEYAVRIRYP